MTLNDGTPSSVCFSLFSLSSCYIQAIVSISITSIFTYLQLTHTFVTNPKVRTFFLKFQTHINSYLLNVSTSTSQRQHKTNLHSLFPAPTPPLWFPCSVTIARVSDASSHSDKQGRNLKNILDTSFSFNPDIYP